MYKLITCLILLSTGIFSCQEKFPEKPFNHDNDSTILKYEFENSNLNIPINTALFAIKDRNILILELQIQNTINRSLKMNLNGLQIETPKGIRSNPFYVKKPKTILNKGEFYHYEIHFEPINSLPLYRKINFKGDLRNNYAINLNSITGLNNQPIFNKQLKFKLSEKDWLDYQKNFAKEDKIKIFEIKIDKQEFIDQQKLYFKSFSKNDQLSIGENRTNSNSINISDHEILINGIALKTSIHTIENQAYTSINLINHGINPIRINPNGIFIEIANKKITTEDLGRKVSQIEILKGKRYTENFVFQLKDIDVDIIQLTLSGITFKSNNKPILDQKLKFEKESDK